VRMGSVVNLMGHAIAEIPSLLAQDDPDGSTSTSGLALNGQVAEPYPRDEDATDVVSSAGDSLDHRTFWHTVEMMAAILPLELG
jgi:hypothetical protein